MITARQSGPVAILAACTLALLILKPAALAQPSPPAGRQFPIGSLSRLEDLPASRLQTDLKALPPAAQERALQWLRSVHFTELDLPSLRVDAAGAIFYACRLTAADATADSEPPPVGEAAVPVSPFPSQLMFHSKPGAPNVLYLNFAGETVTNTAWNTEENRTTIPAVAFSTDTDLGTYSDAEQAAIKRIWQRVAEDYAAFDLDVTTERPGTFNNRTAVALITRSTDANGNPNPSGTGGGVAYLNVFGTTSYSRYRPAWIYHNNLANTESYIAEAASHEIGHNMGLSHDGKTDGTEYYGGHGSGDTSWGPIMGASYNRNVTQWSQGEYYLANNTQDDLSTLAGKIAHRADDHGNTAGTATALVTTGGTNIVSTTPETDPGNTNTTNKGMLERGTDVDVFSLVTGAGPISLSVNPWVMPSGTRGGNVDLSLELYSEAGTLLLTNNPDSQTAALIRTNLAEGRYYLHVRTSGAGSPLSSAPTGYTPYGSLGQYFVSGYVSEFFGFVMPPGAALQATDITEAGEGAAVFAIAYSDNVAIDVSTVDSNDIRITGPNGCDIAAQFVSLDTATDGTPRVATYSLQPPGDGAWSPADNGIYTVWIQTNQVADLEGAWVPAGSLGTFEVAIPVAIYAATMDVDPAWTYERQWQYGAPAYPSTGPDTGYTGTQIIGYNLSGDYPNNLSVQYATTPPIRGAGSSALTLRFRRWLRLRQNDTASIQVSTNGATWITVWSTSSVVADAAWQDVQYPLPASVAGSSSIWLRWGLASNNSQTDIGWNLDDVTVLAYGITPGVLDVFPAEGLNASGTVGGPFLPSGITYTLTNSGGSLLTWTADPAHDWMSLSATHGTLAAGATATIDAWLNSNADQLAAGSYSGTVSFVDTTAGEARYSAPIALRVNPIAIVLAYSALDQQVALTLQGQPHQTYVIEASTDLLQWSAIVTNTAGADGRFTSLDPEAPHLPKRFYRGKRN